MVFGNLGRMLAAAAGERDGSILAAVFESGCGGPQHAEFGLRVGGGIVPARCSKALGLTVHLSTANIGRQRTDGQDLLFRHCQNIV